MTKKIKMNYYEWKIKYYLYIKNYYLINQTIKIFIFL